MISFFRKIQQPILQINSNWTNLTYLPINQIFQKRSNIEPIKIWKIVKGDKVALITGKDKGKSGTVIKVYKKQNKVLIQGLNLKLQRIESQKDEQQQGGVRQIQKPVHISNVALLDPSNGKPTKISLAFTEDGQKVRVSKSSGTIIEKSVDPALQRKIRHKNKQDGIKDTPPNQVIEVTYQGEDFAAIKAEFLAKIQLKEKKESLLVFKN